MTAGAVVAGTNATSSTGTFTIQPSGTNQWCIHDIYVTGACNVIMTDGTNAITIAQLTATSNWLSNLTIHITNTFYLQITDTSGSTNKMAYDGIQTQ